MLPPTWTRGATPAAMDVTGTSTSLAPDPCHRSVDTAMLTVAGGRMRPSSSQANGEATDDVSTEFGSALRLGAVPLPLVLPVPPVPLCAIAGAAAASAMNALAAMRLWRVMGSVGVSVGVGG